MPPTLKSINIFYMKQAVRLFTLGCLVAFLVPSFAQEIKRKHIDHGIDPEQTGYVRCATPDPPAEFEEWFNSVKDRFSHTLGEDQVYRIPVIIHVIHNGSDPVGYRTNISYSQVLSQINALNRDFNKQNADTTQTPDPFKPLAGNVQIEFCPALVDPFGVPLLEPGVNRINRNTAGYTALPFSMTYMDNTVKPSSIWNVNQYFNIWAVNLTGGIAGYATFPNAGGSGLPGLFPPANPSQTDGIVINYQNFGWLGNLGKTHSTGPLDFTVNPYIFGRTAVHEAGHWLGLRHIWGDSNCGDDFVSDTPTQQGPSNGCPTFPATSCGNAPNGNMFMNYMDYTVDQCMNMFSAGQSTRMRTIMTANSIRNSLSTSNKCDNSRTIDLAVEVVRPSVNDSTCTDSITPTILVRNLGTSAITSLDVEYRVDAGTPTTLPLTGTLGSLQVARIALPAIFAGAVGNRTLHVTLKNINGGAVDNYPSNNSTAVAFKRINPQTASQGIPYTQSFTTSTFPPTGWKYDVPNDPYKWARFTGSGRGGFGQDNASIRMDNFNPNHPIWDQSDILELMPMNFSSLDATGVIHFDVAYAQWSSATEDSLSVLVSADCGASWTRIYGKGGPRLATAPATQNAFQPTASQWRRDTISLAAYAGLSNVLIRFENYSDWGNYIYLDNITVKNIPVTAPPVANFNLSATQVCVGDPLSLTDISTNSPTSWAWTFQDGTPATSNAQNPTVVFNSSGVKTITLIASNSEGPSPVASKTVTVLALPAPPTITRNGDVLTSSYATGNQWYKDGVIIPGATGQNYTVTATGVYKVEHTNANGCKRMSADFTVSSLSTPPVANFNFSPSQVCVGAPLTLTDISTNSPTSWAWNFQDGTPATSNAQNPTVVFNSPGVKTITLVATNSSGPSSPAAVKSVTVNALPAQPTITRNGDILTSSYATGNQWFKDGIAIPGATNQNYTVTVAGVYTVQHTNANGCKSLSNNFIVTSVNIFDHIARDFSFEISPNPSSGRFVMELSTQKQGDFSLDIRNVLGQLMESRALGRVSRQHSEVIELGQYGTGVYFITLTREGEWLTKKVIVE